MRNVLLFAIVWLIAGTGPSAGGVTISVDTFAQQMAVIVDGTPRYTWPVSTGRPGYATPAGSFSAMRLERELAPDALLSSETTAGLPHRFDFDRLIRLLDGG